MEVILTTYDTWDDPPTYRGDLKVDRRAPSSIEGGDLYGGDLKA